MKKKKFSLICPVCNEHTKDWYMVKDRIWKKVAKDDLDVVLCVECLESRLGRKLTPKDFKDVPLNYEMLHDLDNVREDYGCTVALLDRLGAVV